MRIVSHAFFMVLLISGSCACPQPSTSETPSGGGGGTAPDLDPGTTPTTPTTPASGGGGGGDRTLAVAASDPLYARVEGTSFQNGCQSDGQCFVGGCSSEICSAEQGVSGTCDMPAAGFPSKGATCGCVSGQCVWYRSGAGTGAGTGAGSGAGAGAGTASKPDKNGGSAGGAGAGTASKPDKSGGNGGGTASKPDKSGGSAGGHALPKQGENCTDDLKCAAGLTCKRYYGIAGARGPEFKTCEIPCSGKGATCPAGQSCVTIADGPGQVCRK